MLNIHSFLQGVKKALNVTCYKSCIMIVTYSLVAIMLVLSSDSFNDTGSIVSYSYAKAETVPVALVEAEETAQDAQIQPDENEKHVVTLENKTTKILTATIGTEMVFDQKEQILQTIETHRMQALRLKEQIELAEQKRLELLAEQKAEAKKAAEEKAAKVKAKAVAAAAKKAKEKEIQLSADEIEVLQRIVEAEAGGEDIKGKILVANVILNRVNNSGFPDSVSGVVFQKNGSTYQFSPVKDGRYWSVNVSKETKEAVNRVLQGEDKSQGALYFSARSKADKSSMSWFDNHLTRLFQYGGHEFYK